MEKYMSDREHAIRAWLIANEIDPKDVLLDADMTIEDGPDGRMLRVEVCDLTKDGRRQIDERGKSVATKFVTVPLKSEPPEWWQPYQKPTREQLLEAMKTSLPSLKNAIGQLPAVCRYHGDRLEAVRPSYGSEACCDTGVSALRRRRAEQALARLAKQLGQ